MKKSLRVLAVTGAATTLALLPAAAQAAPLDVTYDAVGTSYVAGPDATIDIGPTTLETTVESNGGALTGSLDIPKTSISFKAYGFLPASSDVEFIETAPVTGILSNDGTRAFVDATATYTIKLTNTKILGLPTFTGDNCQTAEPVIVPAKTPDDASFSIVGGGPLEGTFSIGEFENCGLTTGIINSIVPGDGNTIDLTVSNGRLG
ncbi:hypothetical protein [Aeromicrobium sp. CF3.5]|uniref:hypothetical protein n=1 Tax=Aeromicrobium sp. CF3.5 TaxID=3373078 RepID=UPI003EE68244